MKIASSGDAEHLQHLFDLVRECRDDRQERGWAVRDDLGTIAGQLQELLKLLVRERVQHGTGGSVCRWGGDVVMTRVPALRYLYVKRGTTRSAAAPVFGRIWKYSLYTNVYIGYWTTGIECTVYIVCIEVLLLFPLYLQLDADPEVCKLVIQDSKYENIWVLVEYYQMVSVHRPQVPTVQYSVYTVYHHTQPPPPHSASYNTAHLYKCTLVNATVISK